MCINQKVKELLPVHETQNENSSVAVQINFSVILSIALLLIESVTNSFLGLTSTQLWG